MTLYAQQCESIFSVKFFTCIHLKICWKHIDQNSDSGYLKVVRLGMTFLFSSFALLKKVFNKEKKFNMRYFEKEK